MAGLVLGYEKIRQTGKACRTLHDFSFFTHFSKPKKKEMINHR
jgi:hypothetical protein